MRVPAENSDVPGPYDAKYSPYILGIYAAKDDPEIGEIVCMKAAQIGWTLAIVAMIGQAIDMDPCAIVVMFPAEGAAREFNDEKFTPVIRATPALDRRIDTSSSRSSGNRALFKTFPAGFIKFVSSNSIRSVKSTPARFVIVEEPDDANDNVNEQGDSIRLLWERAKRMRRSTRILGGTPSLKGISRVEQHMEMSDKRVLPVVCHGCEQSHVLDFENVSWLDAENGVEHPVYGIAMPETAVYSCPHCGEIWDDYHRKENIRNTVAQAVEDGDPMCGWVPTAPFRGIAGFMELNELYSCLPGAGVADLAKDYIEAEKKAEDGDESSRIVFVNSKLGRPYAYTDDQATAETLKELALDYQELVCPLSGLLVTVGVDVQHDRLAVIIRAWGRGQESWLLYWGELPAGETTVDKNDEVWTDLDRLLFSPIKREGGGSIRVAAVTIDSSDGSTSDAVYAWVRTRAKEHKGECLVMAGKGSSDRTDPEIFTQPRKSVDHKRPDRQTKADKRGVRIYQVGTYKAKEWITSRIKLKGTGGEQMHSFKNTRPDYWEQVTSEVKAPHRTIRNRWMYRKKAGVRNEALDCEVYGLHAARAKRVHLLKPGDWDALERELIPGEASAEKKGPAPRRQSDYWR